ncbi:murein hydrolase activator EnvC family protein [Erythrobacter dokdonensis]|uniref:Peptidase M23B n=1 Tax=Erythrobacter dokdonensis DSW-74 TaxID=1300349 RepID=A0A1A7BG52_9SPHN|nr:peptidoglycan DD-metalloendopeptidase family protein [Erythrobacter dokdonensis]OBV10721.1 Peptidase M23B [Erythrobacter dokdonensis DSW-74]
MTPRVPLALLTTLAACAVLALALPETRATPSVLLVEPEEAEAQLARAARESAAAEARAARLTREAEAATEAATRTAAEAAALAARIQQAEADIELARANYSLVRAERAALTARLAEQQEPAARLAAALQTASRRPLALSALQPGSLKELVYVRAVLDSAVPQIQARTADLRVELERGRALEADAARALSQLRAGEADLRERRSALAALENRQRLAMREARGAAQREAERALALAEETRDLDALVARLDDVATLRRELAALPGPVLRPADLSVALPAAPEEVLPVQAAEARRVSFQLPVDGRTLIGFGARRESGLPSSALVLAPVAGAQVVAPGDGRVAFAGPYRGFGRIVIIEHEGGWASLVTGLARIDAEVGDSVISGSPIGVAGGREAPVSFELRRDGKPVNPLQFVN